MIVRTAFWFGVVGAAVFMVAWPLGLIPLLMAPLPDHVATGLLDVIGYVPYGAASWALAALFGFVYVAVPGFAWGAYRAWRERRRYWHDPTGREATGVLREGIGVWAVAIGSVVGVALALAVSLSRPVPAGPPGAPLPLLAVAGIVENWPFHLTCAVLGGLLGHFGVKWVHAVWRFEDDQRDER